MSEDNTYMLSFHARHPTISLSEVKTASSLPIVRSGAIGEHRIGKGGQVLLGKYKSNNVKFALYTKSVKCDDIPIDELMRTYLSQIDFDCSRNIVDTGGFCFFSLGIFTFANVDFNLEVETIQMLNNGKIYVNYDIWVKDEYDLAPISPDT